MVGTFSRSSRVCTDFRVLRSPVIRIVFGREKNYSINRDIGFFSNRVLNLRQKHIKTDVNYVTSGVCVYAFFIVNDRASGLRIRAVRGVNNDVRDVEIIYFYNIYVYIFMTAVWQ